MNKFFKKIIYVLSTVFIPTIASAQESLPTGQSAQSSGGGKVTAIQILDKVTEYINLIIPILIGIGVLVFIWGVFKYFLSKESKDKSEAVSFMLWGIIALFVMIALWGFVNLLQKSFLSTADPTQPPREEIQSLQKSPEIERSNVTSGQGPIFDVIRRIALIIEDALPLLILIGVLLVIVGVLRYAFSPDSSKKEAARNFIIWSIIGLTVMVALWSLVVILQRSVFENSDPSAIGEAGEAVKELQKDPIQRQGGVSRNAQGGGINTTILRAMEIVNDAIPVLVSLGILLFLWGVFKYFASNSAKIKSEGVALMTWGVIVLLIIGSVWGFVNVIADSAGISTTQQPVIRGEGVSPSELILK